MAFLRIRVLNKTSLGDARLIPPPLSHPSFCLPFPLLIPASQGAPSLVRPTCTYTSRAHNLVSVVPHSRPSYIVLVVVVIFFFVVVVIGHRRPLSVLVIEKQTARVSITVVGWGDNTRSSADEKNPTRRRTAIGGETKGRKGRRSREMCLAFRDLVPSGVYRNASTRVRIDMNRRPISRHAVDESFNSDRCNNLALVRNSNVGIIDGINMPTRTIK